MINFRRPLHSEQVAHSGEGAPDILPVTAACCMPRRDAGRTKASVCLIMDLDTRWFAYPIAYGRRRGGADLLLRRWLPNGSRRSLATNGIRRRLAAMVSSPLRLPIAGCVPKLSDRIPVSNCRAAGSGNRAGNASILPTLKATNGHANSPPCAGATLTI
jgi:hypothetical protein